MNIKTTHFGNTWLYSYDVITIVSPENKLPEKDGIPWIAFSHDNKIHARLKADIRETNGMKRTIPDTPYLNLDDLIPLTGCSVQKLIEEIAESQLIPL